jgi:mono/diheme cytochrome c family protein
MSRPLLTALWAAAGLGLGLAATGCESPDPMQKQARFEPYWPSDFFEDGRSMRTPPADTVARETLRGSGPRFTGLDGSAYVDVIPVPVTRAFVEEGRDRFDVFCAACHGLLGDGVSAVARNMALRPPPPIAGEPAFAWAASRWKGRDLPPDGGAPAVRAQQDLPHPLGFYFQAVSQGFGLMPSYADVLPNDERWAVVAYLRALSKSQRVPVASLPPDVRARLEGEATP